jgi:hypothetical protein
MPCSDYEPTSSSQRRNREHCLSSCSGSKPVTPHRRSPERRDHNGSGSRSLRNTSTDGSQSCLPPHRKHYSSRESDIVCHKKYRMPYPTECTLSSFDEPKAAYYERKPSNFMRPHSPDNFHSQKAHVESHFTHVRERSSFSPLRHHSPHFGEDVDLLQPYGRHHSTINTNFKPDVSHYHRPRSQHQSLGGSRTPTYDRDFYATSDYSWYHRSASPPAERNRSLRPCDKMDSQYYCHERSRTPPSVPKRLSRATPPCDANRAFDEKRCSAIRAESTYFLHRRESPLEGIMPHHGNHDLLDR